MNKYIERYQKIVNELIKRSFPELKNRRVKIINFPSLLRHGTILRGKKKDYILIFGKAKEIKDKKALKGFFAHELAHVKDLQRFSPIVSFFKFNLLNDLFILFPFFKPLERNADIIAIRKGYAREMYYNVSKVSKKFPKWIVKIAHSTGYLSPQQIEKYAKKIGKW